MRSPSAACNPSTARSPKPNAFAAGNRKPAININTARVQSVLESGDSSPLSPPARTNSDWNIAPFLRRGYGVAMTINNPHAKFDAESFSDPHTQAVLLARLRITTEATYVQL